MPRSKTSGREETTPADQAIKTPGLKFLPPWLASYLVKHASKKLNSDINKNATSKS